jgi:hypothetical protein
MKMIRGRADARWLPSRHNFALFRLAAYLKMRTSKPEPRNVIIVIDRHQSAIENHSVAAWVFFTVTCFIAATLFRSLRLPFALAVAVPTAFVLVEVPFFATAILLGTWKGDRIRAQSFAYMCTLITAAAWLSTSTSWVRFIAWQFLGFVVLNAIAAVIVFLLRDSIARLENAVGGATSAH